MKLSENFFLDELIHPDILAKIGESSVDFLHPLLVPTLQALRDKFGRIVVNGEYRGIVFTNSGLRKPRGTVGAALSRHKFGCAADCKFDDIEPIDVQNYVIQHQQEFPYITRLENALVTKTWLHIEVGNRHNSIKVFNP